MKKKRQVVMVPTDKKVTDKPFSVGITLCNDGKLRIGNPVGTSESRQELYILSDENLEVCDWCYDSINKIIIQFNNTTACILANNQKEKYNNKSFFKIIATTDKSLEICQNIKSEYCNNSEIIGCNLPQPSQSFITKFIDEWNKGNKITEVMVEFEEIETEDYLDITVDMYDEDIEYQLKIDKNNEITITMVKDNYSIEEIINDIEQAMIQGLTLAQYRDKWILQ